MKIYKIFSLIIFLLFLSQSSTVLAVKQAPQDISPLQPIPAGIAPDISHNINSQPVQIQANVSPVAPDTTSAQNPSNNLPNTSPKSNNIVMIIIFIVVILVFMLLIFLYFKK